MYFHLTCLRVSQVNVRGAEVTPDVNLSAGKYGIRLEVPAADGMSDVMLRCETVRHVLATAGEEGGSVDPCCWSGLLRVV